MDLPLRTVVFGFDGSKHRIIELLEEKGLISVATQFCHDQRPGTIHLPDLYWDKGGDVGFTYHIPMDFFQKFQKKSFTLFLANMGRFDSYTGLYRSFSESVSLFRRLSALIFDILVRDNVQLFLCGGIPHEIIDCLCESMCAMLGIQVRIFVTPPYQKEYFFCLQNSMDYGIYKNKKVLRAIEPTSLNTFVIENSTKKSSQCLLFDRAGAWVAKKTNAAFSTRHVARYNLHLYEQHVKEISDISEQDIIPDHFVFFPLHYQPEASTLAFSPVFFDDQVMCIEYLAQILPNNVSILIKESPIQNFYYREKIFYSRLRAIPQVRFVATAIDSHELIKKAKFVATVTGTAGWEALYYGKPVVYFGNPTYREMPGAFRFTQDLDIERVFRHEVSRADLELCLGHMLATLYRGSMDEELVEDKEGNIIQCVESVESIIMEIVREKTEGASVQATMMAQISEKTRSRGISVSSDLVPLAPPKKHRERYPYWQRQGFKLLRHLERTLIKARLRLLGMEKSIPQ